MNEVASLMESQIKKCIDKEIDVQVSRYSSLLGVEVDKAQKVVLIGGYGDNRALRTHLTERLEEISHRVGKSIRLKTSPQLSAFHEFTLITGF